MPNDYTTYTWMRVLNRTVTQIGPDHYQIDAELSPIPPVCPDGPTEETTYPANLSETSAGLGHVMYTRAGIGAPTFAPTPGYPGAWHFFLGNQDRPGDIPDVAGYDLGAFNAGNTLHVISIGDGSMAIHTIQSSGGAAILEAKLQHEAPSAGGGFDVITDETQTGITAGDVITFSVSSHGRTFCTHKIVVADIGGVAAGWGFYKAVWTPAAPHF